MQVLSNLTSIMMIATILAVFLYLLLSGIMWTVRPIKWADSPWSLCPPQYRQELNRRGVRLQARISGLFLIGMGLLVALVIVNKLLRAAEISTIDLEAVVAVLFWLLRYGTITALTINGTVAVILPRKLVASNWSVVPVFRALEEWTGKDLTLLVRIEGIVFLAMAYLMYNPPGS